MSLFRSLDFIYIPSGDVKKDFTHYTEALGCKPVFSISAFGTRVAGLRLGDGGPMILLVGHLEGQVPILIYRVDNFEQSVKELKKHGIKGTELEIPHGPCFSFKAQGGQRIAIYELKRPEANTHLEGKFDP